MISLDIPSDFIDFRRMLAAVGSGNLPLLPEIETWLADNNITCGVAAAWRARGYVATFNNSADAAMFKLWWL